MIPNEEVQRLETFGDVKVIGNYHITEANQARILVSLSDKMYTRKELAVIREYSNNANDAHIVAGKPTSEVIITLPTYCNLNFKVRDFGSGLTVDQIRNVYCVLGESTKRNSASQNGVLGYGCKAGFAHADSFTVTSWINGEKAVYNCIKGDSNRLHNIIELVRCPSDEPSGIEVCVPVKQSSLWTFHCKAADFFKYWETLPTIIDMDGDSTKLIMDFRNLPPVIQGENWNIRKKSQGQPQGVAFMGGVAYNINWNVIYNHMSLVAQTRALFDIIQKNDVVLYYKMGEVQFVDSREGLEYTDFTLKAVTDRIETIFAKIEESIQEIFSKAPTIWDAKILYNSIFTNLPLEVEKGEDPNVVESIQFLEGNFKALDSVTNKFNWNGIPIGSASFQDINRFDNYYPNEIKHNSHSPISPVMITFRNCLRRG